jgi:Uncharacterized protein conserved in bacteria (DUF2062)
MNSPTHRQTRIERIEQIVAAWLRQGITPQRLALTLALGFTIGCIPVLGAPTLLCAAVAVALGLNMPAMQAANYAAMPFQLALLVPFVRLGAHIFAPAALPILAGQQALRLSPALLWVSPLHLAAQVGAIAGRAMAGWLLVAIPAVALITLALHAMLKRIPALAAAEAGD